LRGSGITRSATNHVESSINLLHSPSRSELSTNSDGEFALSLSALSGTPCRPHRRIGGTAVLAFPALRGSREATILLRSMQVHPCSSHMRKRAERVWNLKLFCTCSQEAVLLQPYPETWKDLVGSRGECFACGSVQKVLLPTILSSALLSRSSVMVGALPKVLTSSVLHSFRSLSWHAVLRHRSKPSSSRPARGSRYGCSMGATIESSHNKYSSSSYVS
jgi:hypothetical protein